MNVKKRSFVNFPLGKIKFLIGLLIVIVLISGCIEKELADYKNYDLTGTKFSIKGIK